ncbi:MAG: YebC/PmpR family DNA-binding transcriptional regulator [Planctomycetota bacterium]|nr:YebC/PmpR family DNA-binding transcriptional regulator [Planctomycetota bacterium]
MAGHSKWANIKHRKARQDAVKGKAWSKCSRAIMVAVKNGGPDPETNLTLRYAILDAKSVNMPKDTIVKAISKASGEGSDGAVFQEIRYEGYGASGVAIIVDCLTDNVQRTGPDLRHAFEKYGGNLAKPGAVAFGFQTKGVVLVESAAASEDQIMELALEAGAEDVTESDGGWEITTEPSDFVPVLKALEEGEIPTVSAEITMIPDLQVSCDADSARKLMTMVDAFEDHDDVQKVYTNADISDEIMASLNG